jgi:hypothetical protein
MGRSLGGLLDARISAQAPLLALAVILVTGCGTSSGEHGPSVLEARSARPPTAASYPALLVDPHRLAAVEAAFVANVPSEVRPASGSVVRIPTPPGVIERYWLAPWADPPRPGLWFCLYSAGPRAAGPATQCFDARTYREGRAYALSARRGHVELVGFNPDPRGSAALRYAHRTVPLTVTRNVFVASSAARPERLELTVYGRNVVLPVGLPADLP